MTLIWLVVPALLTIGGVVLTLVVRTLDGARRALRVEVVALVDARDSLLAVQQRIDATGATAPARPRR